MPPDLIARAQDLKLADVVDIALRNSTLTSVAWAQARAAAAAYGAARGQYYPTIAIDGSVSKSEPIFAPNIRSTLLLDYGPGATLSWLLFDFGGRGGSIGEAREALVAADWTHNATIQNVVLGVESAYFTYMATKSLLVAQQTTLHEAQTNLAAADERHHVGVATIADVLQSKTAESQAELAVETTEGALQTTRGALALSMGLPANVPYDIDVPPPGPLPLGITDSLDTLIERGIRDRPDLLALQAQVRQAEARITAARGAALPSLVLSGNTQQLTYTNPTSTAQGYTATIALQFPIFSGWSQIYNVKSAEAAAEAARQQELGFEQQVTYEVFSAYYALRTATQQVKTSADLLGSATASDQVALGRYKEGAGSLLDLLTAQAALATARALDIQARFSWYLALAQLAHDAGILGVDGNSPLHVQTDTTGQK
ncbi:MAG TPA: TolC family protein [Gemmatimonadales bacterium]|nr:TolC family protein [Gemmatimonadales bacterium]